MGCSNCDQCPACGRNNAADIVALERSVGESIEREKLERKWHYEQADRAHELREALEAMFQLTGAANGSPGGDEPAEAKARAALLKK